MDSNGVSLTQAKSFEAKLKQMLTQTYGQAIPEDRITLLNVTEYVDDDLVNGRTPEQIRGEMSRMMFDDVIDLECFKEIKLEDGDTMEFPYGTGLEMSLIEFYTYELAQKFGFTIDQAETLSEDINVANKLINVLGDEFDYLVFNREATDLLDAANIKELIEKYDDEAVETYFESLQSRGDDVDKNMKDKVDRSNALQIVYLNDKRNLKYTDEHGRVHLMDITNMPSVDKYYQRAIAALKPGEKLNPEKFFSFLKNNVQDEMILENTSDVKRDDLNSERVDMLQFIESNPDIARSSVNQAITHSTDQTIHVVEDTNDIVVTKNEPGHVDASIVKDGYSKSEETHQKELDISTEILTKDEYILLNAKFLRNEYLSIEELEALRRAAPIYAQEIREEQEQKAHQEKPAVLKPNNNTGVTIKTFALYFVVLTLLIASVVAIILLG